MRRALVTLALLCLCAVAFGDTHGWRGNWTGLYPDADAPVTWDRTSTGIAGTLKISAERPKGADAGDAKPMRHNFPRQWLMIGPFDEGPEGYPQAAARLDRSYIPDEPNLRPAVGDKAGDLAWQLYEVPEEIMPPHERGSVAGSTDLRWVRFHEAFKALKHHSVCYAHTHLHAEKDAEVEVILDHGYGVRVWVNGEEVYREVETRVGLGMYTFLGKFRATYSIPVSPRFRVTLKKGWNRVLLKMTPYRWVVDGYFGFGPRIVDPPGTRYVDTNILWAAPVYDRSNATPIVVGDRVIVMAEPDQVFCFDKKTGRQLWTHFVNRYYATPKAERDANPAFREKLDPLIAKLPEMKTLEDRMALRKQIDAALVEIDEKYKLDWDGHMQAHFRVVGWTVGTPVSDGKSVWVWCGNGIAACYDLSGETRWIRRVNTGKLYYPASPALIDGKLIVYASGGFNMVALDAATGAELWRQPRVDKSVASLIPARIRGVPVVVSQQADVVRIADGKLLFERPIKGAGDSGWAPPVVLGDVVYQPYYGANLMILDFSEVDPGADAWTPRRTDVGVGVSSKTSKGAWVDRWSCGSPLIHEGIYYNIDVFGTLTAIDLGTKKPLYHAELSWDFDMLTHYNAVGVSASITLGGRHLYAMDNQGTCVVFEPGREFRKVAVNHIRTTARRPWPMRPQEEIGYSPPTFEGSRMYLRGEQHFYCIGR